MFMKHTISRFFRFFLVAALVAAMAGSLLPAAKVAGQAACTLTAAGVDPAVSVCATASANVAGESASWTIKFVRDGTDLAGDVVATDGSLTSPGGNIELTFANANVVTDGAIAGAVITVASTSTISADANANPPVLAGPAAPATRVREGQVTGQNGNSLSFPSPVGIADGATATIEIAAVTENVPSATGVVDAVDESGTRIVAHQERGQCRGHGDGRRCAHTRRERRDGNVRAPDRRCA